MRRSYVVDTLKCDPMPPPPVIPVLVIHALFLIVGTSDLLLKTRIQGKLWAVTSMTRLTEALTPALLAGPPPCSFGGV